MYDTVKEPTGVSSDLELVQPLRPIFKAMFSDKRVSDGFIQVSGPTTSVGGKKQNSPLFPVKCDRKADKQIDWSNVDQKGLEQLSIFSKLVRDL